MARVAPTAGGWGCSRSDKLPAAGQRKPTEGTFVRRAGHGERRVAEHVRRTAVSERLFYRQVSDGRNVSRIRELARRWGCNLGLLAY